MIDNYRLIFFITNNLFRDEDYRKTEDILNHVSS